MRAILIFVAAVMIDVSDVWAATGTHYGFFTGVELHDACGAVFAAKRTRSDIRTALRKEGECRGYIIGISDVLGTGAGIEGFRSCLPARTTDQNVVRAVLRWLAEKPEQRQRTGPSLVAEALAASFPCR